MKSNDVIPNNPEEEGSSDNLDKSKTFGEMRKSRDYSWAAANMSPQLSKWVKLVSSSRVEVSLPHSVLTALNWDIASIFSSAETNLFWQKIREEHSKLDGYETQSFLPVYRIGIDDTLDSDKLYAAIEGKEKEIIESARTSLHSLDDEDSLKALFEEALSAIEQGNYFAGQSLLAHIYTLIRDTRFILATDLQGQLRLQKGEPFPIRLRDEVLSYRKNKGAESNTFDLQSWEDISDIIQAIISKYTDDDVKLSVITLYVFLNTKNLSSSIEENDPQRIASRNGMNHSSSKYFSRYNCLCFVLYVSEVFDLIYKLESEPNSIIKPKTEWA